MTDNVRQETFDLVTMTRQAQENVKDNREYKKLDKELAQLDPRRDLLKYQLVQTKMHYMEQQELERLQQQEMNRRKDIKAIAEMLQGEQRQQYDELLSGISLLLDLMDSTFSDLNLLLMRNKVGIQIDKFPELQAARKMLWNMANKEQDKMPQYRLDLWADESERLYKHLRDRMTIYRRKVEREEARQDKAVQDVKIQFAALDKLRAANAIDAELIWNGNLIDRTKLALDANGALTGMDEILADLQKNKAHLFKAADEGKGGAPAGTGKDGGDPFKGVTTKEEFLKLDADKQIAFKQANPALFKQFLQS